MAYIIYIKNYFELLNLINFPIYFAILEKIKKISFDFYFSSLSRFDVMILCLMTLSFIALDCSKRYDQFIGYKLTLHL